MKIKNIYLGLLMATILTTSVLAQTADFSEPVAVRFAGVPETLSVGQTIQPEVDVALNGAIVSSYEWFLDNTSIGTGIKLSSAYTILNTDHGKTLKVVLDTTKGLVSLEYKNITLENTFLAETNESFPTAGKLNDDEFPIVYGKTVTDPTDVSGFSYDAVDRGGSNYFVTQDPAFSGRDGETGYQVTYKGKTYSCTIKYYLTVADIPTTLPNFDRAKAGLNNTSPIKGATFNYASLFKVNSTYFFDKGYTGQPL